jgi:hypothetical protein
MSGENDHPSLTRSSANTEAIRVSLDRLEHSVSYLRHLRVGGVLFLMALAALLGAGGTVALFWSPYQRAQQAQRFTDLLAASGIHARISDQNDGVHFIVQGPEALHGTAWQRDNAGYIVGAEFIYPTQNGQ